MAILWGAPPPRKLCQAHIRLLCLTANQEVQACVLGPCVGVQTHWCEGRTRPCVGEEKCQFHDMPRTWKGFVPVICDGWSPHGKSRGVWTWVLVVTEEIGEAAVAWERGTLIRVMRPGSKSNGPLTFQVLATGKGDKLPPTFDVIPYVLRASGMSQTLPVLFSPKKKAV